MDPLAQELNDIIQEQNLPVYFMLSDLGKSLFFPKGILAQAAEAKQKAKKYNATIGIAKEGSGPMYLPCIQQYLAEIDPKDSYPYAPAAGKPELRAKWREKLLEDNPLLRGKRFGLPIVTSGLTHGLSLAGDLFVESGDVVIVPDKFWENYSLTYGTRRGAEFRTFPLFTFRNTFNVEGFKAIISEVASEKDKVTVILNFPNNPTGYTITPGEAEQIAAVIESTADQGVHVVAIIDDAYFGLFYDDEIMHESIFGLLANIHPRVLAVKLDGPTKEQFVWGFRVGFITYGLGGKDDGEVYAALEKKTMGAIRSGISTCSHLAQSIILKGISSPNYKREKSEKVATLQRRAQKVREVLKNEKYNDLWDAYPFNSGYFMCLKLKTVKGEDLRVHLLDKYGIGTISMDTWDVRITFSSIEEETIEDFFETVACAVKELEK
ncbi:MAG: aminotransferase class I/II-fold pyridoxal phosphate-dependent enzyme [Deltaproteobacteria bacterium]|nr:aminotransferase class I/II-fold pyridoxal phosphate-dependent enzyme [Deltaproteobacteria bacterium]